MLRQKPISMAVSATCLLAGGNAVAAEADKVSELCGTTITENTYIYYCTGDTLTADCKIEVSDGNSLTINDCALDANNYELEIKGDYNASLSMDNGFISNAANIEIKFKGREIIDDNTSPCHYNTVIDIDDYDLRATGEDSKIKISSDCGRIDIRDTYSYDNNGTMDIVAGDSVDIKAKIGDVHVGDYDGNSVFIGAGPYYEAGGSIHLSAGGETDDCCHDGGTVTTNCVDMSAGSIKVSSDGNMPFVGCYTY